MPWPGKTKGGSITVQLTSCLTCLDYSVLQMKTKIVVDCHTADFKPVKQEVNSTMILPPFSVPCCYLPWQCKVALSLSLSLCILSQWFLQFYKEVAFELASWQAGNQAGRRRGREASYWASRRSGQQAGRQTDHSYSMDRLKLTVLNLGRVFNYRCGHTST